MKANMFLASTLAVFTVLTATSGASATTWYVVPTGADTNPCTQPLPCATITQASTLAQPGDTVLVGPGTYNTPTGPGGQTVYTTASGQAGLPITYLSQPRWGAVISQGPIGSAWSNSGSYVVIDGFEIVGNPSGIGDNGIFDAGQNSIIQHNKVHGLQTTACTTIGGAGISTNAQFITVQGNLVYGNGPAGCSFVHGIYMTAPFDVAADNVAFLNSGYGIQANHTIYNEVIVNNTTFNNGSNGAGGGIFVGSSDPVVVDHNIVDNNINFGEPNGISFEFGTPAAIGPNNAIDNNLCDPTTTLCLNLPSGVGSTNNNLVNIDPQFVNYQPDGSGDYHLQGTSPAIVAGLSGDSTPDGQFSAPFPAADYDGNAWAPQFGVGAFKFVPAPLAFVQVRDNLSTDPHAYYESFSVNIATKPGDLLVAFVRESSNATDNFTVTDSAGQMWTPTSSGYLDESDTGPRIGMFYMANSAAVSSVSVRYTTSGGVIKPGIMVMEISGAATSDVADGSVNNASFCGATASVSKALTTTQPGDFLIFATDTAGDDDGWIAGTGFTIPQKSATGGSDGFNVRMSMQYAIVPTALSNATTWMLYEDWNWNGNIFAAFK